MNDEQIINPDEFTVPELVKHIYRELKGTRAEVGKLQQDVAYLKQDLTVRKAREKERDAKFNKRVSVVGIIGVALGFVIDLLIGLI